MTDYTPDRWVVLEINDLYKPFYKVLAGWSGGYLDGDSWRINSGIEAIVEHEDYYDFYGSSGSSYRCYKSAEGMTVTMAGIYKQLQERYGDQVTLVEGTDWMEGLLS